MRHARVRVGLNHMDFCDTCRHGQPAHRHGTGQCFAERRLGGVWMACECAEFVKPPADQAQDTP